MQYSTPHLNDITRAEIFVHNPAIYTSADGMIDRLTSTDGIAVASVLSVPIGGNWRECSSSVIHRLNRWISDSDLYLLQTAVGLRDPVSNDVLVADLVLSDLSGDKVILACVICTCQTIPLLRRNAVSFLSRLKHICEQGYACDADCCLLVFNSLGSLTVVRVGG